jgi:transaldolase
MQIFLDTIDIKEITFFQELSIVDGITTNPSLISKANQSFKETVESICRIVLGPVSVEVVATEYEQMLKEALYIAEIAENIVVKLPMTWEGLKVCNQLSQRKIKTNLTLCFTANQALLAAKVGATYVSPFIGRLDDIAASGVKLVEEIKKVFDNYNIGTKILAASIRSPEKVLEVCKIGVDVVTLPPKILEQMIVHPLTSEGLQKFLNDWNKSGLSL